MNDEESIAKGSNGLAESLNFTVPNLDISMLITLLLTILLAPRATVVINAAIGWLLYQATQWTEFNHTTSYIQIVSTTILMLLLLIGSVISLIPILEGKKFHNLDV